MFEKLRNAWRRVREQRRNPTCVATGVRAIDAMGELLGRGDASMVRVMRASKTGRDLLQERRDVLDFLTRRDWLKTLPEGSLGRAYLDFVETNRLYPEVLAKVVREARVESDGFVPNATPEAAFLQDRYRDLHDLWHVATGYETDMAGEWGLLAFQTKQTGYHSMMFIALTGCLREVIRGRPDLLKTWMDGRRRAGRSAPLLAQDWEGLLPMPLARVREKLGLNPPPRYRRFDYPPHRLPAGAAASEL
jgi:ubiquinone biosynthesis protein COQ4